MHSQEETLGFVDGSLTKPSNNLSGKAWDRVDIVVMGWIIGVIKDSIANRVLSFKTFIDIWDKLEDTYGQNSKCTNVFNARRVKCPGTNTRNEHFRFFLPKLRHYGMNLMH